MKTLDQQNLLLQFYFGAVTESERLAVERDLLVDQEALLNFLDLKRKVEAAVELPQEPSPFLWQRLRQRVPQQRRMTMVLSLGAMVTAAIIAVCFLVRNNADKNNNMVTNHILFDSSAELSASSSVL